MAIAQDETDTGIGRLARRYAETNRKIACVVGLLDEVEPQAFEAAHALRELHRGDCDSVRARFEAVDWGAIREKLATLTALREGRAKIEDCLRQAGMGGPVRSPIKSA